MLKKGVCLKLSWSLRKHTVEGSHADRLLTQGAQDQPWMSFQEPSTLFF